MAMTNPGKHINAKYKGVLGYITLYRYIVAILNAHARSSPISCQCLFSFIIVRISSAWVIKEAVASLLFVIGYFQHGSYAFPVDIIKMVKALTIFFLNSFVSNPILPQKTSILLSLSSVLFFISPFTLVNVYVAVISILDRDILYHANFATFSQSFPTYESNTVCVYLFVFVPRNNYMQYYSFLMG